jgi:tRNA (mo5U34)-methyltransferase
MARFSLPEDLTGATLLDIGAWDGWFSFEAEKRGARVTAVDCVEIANFLRLHHRLGSCVEYRILDVYELPGAGLGRFDYVLFLGVLYHLKHPLLALEIVCALTGETAVVESFAVDAPTWAQHPERIPWMEFYETDELGGLLDNWSGPSVSCIVAMARAAGFARVEVVRAAGTLATVVCHRRWLPPPNGALAPPELLSVKHTRNNGINFHTAKDEYISWWFDTPEPDLTRDSVFAEVSGWGVPAMYLRREQGTRWLLNTRLPPGLSPGWHEVRVRTARSAYSVTKRIAVNLAVSPTELLLTGATDGVTWEDRTIDQSKGGFGSFWLRGLSENADCANVVVRVGAERLAVEYVSEPDEFGGRQVNARIPEPIRPGVYPLTIDHGPASLVGFSIRVR